MQQIPAKILEIGERSGRINRKRKIATALRRAVFTKAFVRTEVFASHTGVGFVHILGLRQECNNIAEKLILD